jgi:hypothetical protein
VIKELEDVKGKGKIIFSKEKAQSLVRNQSDYMLGNNN